MILVLMSCLGIIFFGISMYLYRKRHNTVFKILTIVVSIFSISCLFYTAFAFLDDGLINSNITKEDIFRIKDIDVTDDWLDSHFTKSEIERYNDGEDLTTEAKKQIVNDDGANSIYLNVLVFDDEESALEYYKNMLNRPYEIVAVDESYDDNSFNYTLSLTSYRRSADPLFYGFRGDTAYNTRVLVRNHNAIFDFSEVSHSKKCCIPEVIKSIL